MYPTPLRPSTKRRPLNLLAPGKSEWFDLDGPVGATPASQRNQRQDTLKLEVGLANAGHLDFSKTKGPTGYWGQKEDKALRAFQQDNGLKVDGLANPGGPTVKTLEKRVGPRLAPFSPPTPDDVDHHHNTLTEPGKGHLVTEPPALGLAGLERILLPLPAEQAAANQRTVEALLGAVDDGDLPDWAAKGIADAPDSLPVWQDMFLRLNRHDPRRANLTAWAILDRLEPQIAHLLLGRPLPDKMPLGVLSDEAAPRLLNAKTETTTETKGADKNPKHVGADVPSVDKNESPQVADQPPVAASHPESPRSKTAGMSTNPTPSLAEPPQGMVNPFEMYKNMAFQEKGSGHWGVLIDHRSAAIRGKAIADEVSEVTKQRYGRDNPGLGGGEGDAFRHALWSYRMTRELGAEVAKEITDAHERHTLDTNPMGDRLMDLYNNRIGRLLAQDPGNRDRPDEEVVLEAIQNGHLQLQPFEVDPLFSSGLEGYNQKRNDWY
ncbi:peptidoglycan-binding domain-containing protein [Roseospirillum parvum]|uniref:Putative peptidoglycan binding domain-containing protein n=1 Tax=Roseospirillum parvum TaxID=83401 RepID=A0A1G8E9B8_9PROT|nr:peptidoglycan-binding domain-containing protein [Roseospirillum parvum]SDH66461.1 Putative peptidoglycan binding domain-containing protein [Roseospirillum parvum]